MIHSLLATLAASCLSSCTAITPEISNLGSLSPFASKSQSPFQQDGPGRFIIFSGVCVPTVTGFEFRMNDLPQWTQIPSETPLPGTGEYLTGDLEYDVDCSNGTFNFYAFHSHLMSNFTSNGSPNGDPYKIELRPISDIPLPSIIFERPPPVGFRIETWDHMARHFGIEEEEKMSFHVTLQDASGSDTTPGASDIPFTLSLTNLTDSANLSDQLFQNDCSTAVTVGDKVMGASEGDRSKEFCLQAPATSSPEEIQLTVAAAGLPATHHKIRVYPKFSAAQSIGPAYSEMPPHFVKGVEYRMRLELLPLFNYLNSPYRYVQGFDGDFSLTASSPSIMLKGNEMDPYCPTSYQAGSLACVGLTTSSTYFVLKIPESYSGSTITLSAQALPKQNCSGCLIYDPADDTNKLISAYAPGKIQIPVKDGGGDFTQPYFTPFSDRHGSTVDVDECQRGLIGAANSKGHAIPTSNYTNWTLSSPTLWPTNPPTKIVDFYYSYEDCTSDVNKTTSFSTSLSGGYLVSSFYYKVNTMPPDGKVQFKIEASGSSWLKDYYLELQND